MKYLFISIVSLFSLLISLTSCSSPSKSLSHEPAIKHIVACNVYWEDYRYTSLPTAEAGKFVVTFDTDQRVDVELIESITVNGPNGYFNQFEIQPFDIQNLSGYVDEVENNFIWFQTYDKNGFLINGEYTITLKYKSNKQSQKSRVLNYTPGLLESYKNIHSEFTPSGSLPKTINSEVELTWTVLPDKEAYYATRLMAYTPEEPSAMIIPKFFDNIFGYGDGNSENTGLNKESVTIPLALDVDSRYLWFTEILDSNKLDEINIAIFEPAQFFWFEN